MLSAVAVVFTPVVSASAAAAAAVAVAVAAGAVCESELPSQRLGRYLDPSDRILVTCATRSRNQRSSLSKYSIIPV